MIKHYEILACEIDLNELVFCLKRIEEKLIKLENQNCSSSTISEPLSDELLTRQEVAKYLNHPQLHSTRDLKKVWSW